MMARFSVVGLLLLCSLGYLGSVQARQGLGSGEQEWGYAEVVKGAHMFWWLYYTTDPTVTSPTQRPLVIWLQGGPGGSSTGYGNFEELGPLNVNLEPRNSTWVKNYNVLFIDNPVGTGFSYVDNPALLAKDNKRIASDLVQMMRLFYKQLPEFLNVSVYITSESYGGKMAAEFALEWVKARKQNTIGGNLKGVGLGDSWVSPIDSVLTWAPYLLQAGMVDTEGYKKIDAAARRTEALVKAGKWAEATRYWSYTEGVILTVTQNIDFYNILTKVGGSGFKQRSLFEPISEGIKPSERASDAELDALMNGLVKKTLNLKSSWGTQNGAVFQTLSVDFMKPATKVVEELLAETDLKVFVYTGQLDLIVDTPGTLLWVENLNWKDIQKWKQSRRVPVVADGIIEGYRKTYGNLAFYWINRAGHMVPADNPAATAVLLRDLTN